MVCEVPPPDTDFEWLSDTFRKLYNSFRLGLYSLSLSDRR